MISSIFLYYFKLFWNSRNFVLIFFWVTFAFSNYQKLWTSAPSFSNKCTILFFEVIFSSFPVIINFWSFAEFFFYFWHFEPLKIELGYFSVFSKIFCVIFMNSQRILSEFFISKFQICGSFLWCISFFFWLAPVVPSCPWTAP